MPVPALARWLLGVGIAATLAANVAHGLGHGLVGGAVAAWPAVALVGSYELLMVIIRNAQPSANTASRASLPGAPSAPNPLQEYAAQVFADDLAAFRVPSVRAIRATPCRPAPGTASTRTSGDSHQRITRLPGPVLQATV
jgi:hypothetical protein